MRQPIFIHLLPSHFEPQELRGGVAVVFDVLRASTTILHALANGATRVVACGSIDEARRVAEQTGRDQTLLAGERGGVLIEGFDLDNSPQRYSPDIVTGKTIIFTTTNGTAALLRSREASSIYVGAFVNLTAVVERLQAETGPIHLVCAGTEGKVTTEDACCAGAVAQLLLQTSERGLGNDEGKLAMSYAARYQPATYVEALEISLGGMNCRQLGFAEDVEIAGTVDLFNFVPIFDPNTREIRRVDG